MSQGFSGVCRWRIEPPKGYGWRLRAKKSPTRLKSERDAGTIGGAGSEVTSAEELLGGVGLATNVSQVRPDWTE